jgi:hypothetical protein
MHRILLREVLIDTPAETFAATRDFWAGALDARPEVVTDHPEFTSLRNPAALPWVGLQRLESGTARFHLDFETDDIPGEVERLSRLGAVEVERSEAWVVMKDPSGLLFCLLPPLSPEFDERARTVS